MSLAASGISVRAGGQTLIEDASLTALPGRVHALLGANGAGKSTLLHALAGAIAPVNGTITINGRALAHCPRWNLARLRALLPQQDALRFAFRAEEIVALGTHPAADRRPATIRARVAEALARAGATELARRRYTELSGGERARVQFARVIAQLIDPAAPAPRYLLLDEPTAHLDLAHQHACLAQLRQLAADGIGVLVVLHDPNLALRYADDATLLRGGRVLAQGHAAQALRAETLETAYGLQLREWRDADGRLAFVSLAGEAVSQPGTIDINQYRSIE
jgi:iron complex transport system ATP-binding protein